MTRNIKTLGVFIIASAIIWGAVIIGCSYALRGTECYAKIQNILVGGVVSHLILIWGPMSSLSIFKISKDNEDKTKNDNKS